MHICYNTFKMISKIAFKSIYATINYLGMIYIKFKSENIKDDLVFPRCATGLGKQTSTAYFDFDFSF